MKKAVFTVPAILLCCSMVLPCLTGCLQKDAGLLPFEEIESICVGDHFTFGSFLQSCNGSSTDTPEDEPIEWRVLDIKDGNALIISEYLLTPIEYNISLTDVTWEMCSLRKWLNGSFYDRAFTENEHDFIQTSLISNPDNPLYGTCGGNDTEDKIFCLSLEEAQLYFADADDRMAAPTEEAVRRGASINDDSALANGMKTGWWWLRSPASSSDRAADVDCYGNIDTDYIEGSDFDGDLVFDETNCVRPALWVSVAGKEITSKRIGIDVGNGGTGASYPTRFNDFCLPGKEKRLPRRISLS